MKYISAFSGIEAASVAWRPLGWEPVAFSEIDPFPSAVLAERFPDVPNLGDITKVDWKRWRGKCDLVVGGSPCQSFSVAGKREGLKGESGLMFEYVRAIREIRPRWLVWENVPGALSSEGGEAFRCLLSELDKLGYGLAWRVLDAQFFGVAQRRRRVFLVGRLGEQPPACVLFEPEGLRGDTPSSREKRQELAAAAGRGASRAGGDGAIAVQGSMIGRSDENGPQGCGWETDGACFTLNCADRHAVTAPRMAVRRLTPRECERLQGFEDDWTRIPYRGRPAEECPDGPRYKAIGNSMAVPVMRWIGERIAMCERGEIR